MTTVAQVANSTDVATLSTTLLDSAAAIENLLHDSELQIQSLKRELRRAQYRYERAQQWIVRLRRSHRHDSHARTGKLFTRSLSDLAALDAMPEIGSHTITVHPVLAQER